MNYLVQPEDIPLEIIFEDEDMVALNKSAGMTVYPGIGHPGGTVANALLARYPDMAAMFQGSLTPQPPLPPGEGSPDPGPSLGGRGAGGEGESESEAIRPGLVHRLDRDTSGVMVVARTLEALGHLQQQFKARTVEKKYLALVVGRPPVLEGIIEVPLGRDPRRRQRMTPQADGKPARTHYYLRAELGDYSLLELRPETGRTHQIRVHLAWLGCPVVGDKVYGRPNNALGLTRQFLHAWRLRVEHPRRGEPLALVAPLPPDLRAALADLSCPNLPDLLHL
jgi:23S rRNA pseudouridine1911/1915/1917 synthase